MSSGIISVSTTQPTLEGSPESQDLDMHDLGGVLSWEAPESMLRVMSDLVMLVAVLLGKIWTFYGCLWIYQPWVTQECHVGKSGSQLGVYSGR